MGDLVLVTGADGFVGRHLVDHLRMEGHRVRALDRQFGLDFPKDIEQIEADILDFGTLTSALTGVRTVYHLAAYTGLWAPDPGVYQSVNMEGTNTVLRAAMEAGVERFVHCSSFVTVISGSRSRVLDVDENPNIETEELFGAYAQSKKRAEDLVIRAAKDGKIRAVALLPSAPIGAGDHNLTAPTRFLRDLINGDIPATMEQMTNFVDVKILAYALMSAADKGRTGERYLITGENLAMPDFLAKVARISGVKMPTLRIPYFIAATAAQMEERLVCKITKKAPKAPIAGVAMAGRKRAFRSKKAQDHLGYVVAPIDEALRASLHWLKQRGEIKRNLPGL